MLNKIVVVLSLCMAGCLAPIESESESEEITQAKEAPAPDGGNGSSYGFGCGSVYQELEGPGGVTLEIPVECIPFYIYMGDPLDRENPFVGLQEQQGQ